MFVYNICFEVASAAFLVILYIYIRLQYSRQSEANKAFEKLTLYVLAANVADVVSAITLSYARELPHWINLVTNSAYFILIAFLGYQFTVYTQACVKRKEMELLSEKDAFPEKKNFMGKFNQLIMLAFFGVFIANAFTGVIFSIGEQGEYVHGPLYLGMYIMSFYFISCSGFVMLTHYRLFEKWQLFSVFIYLIIAFIGPLLQMLFFPDVLLAVFSSALGLVMMLFSMETPDYQKLVKTMAQLEQAQAKAEKASQAKSRFLANMSHEVRTPVNALLGYNEMILKESKDTTVKEYAHNVQSAGKVLISMFDDILDFINLDSGELTLSKETYETIPPIQELVTYTLVNAGKKNLKVHLDIDENLPRKLWGDMPRLMQITNNLVSNAVKYTIDGFVCIRIKWNAMDLSHGTLCVDIEDTGIGIQEDEIPRIVRCFSGMETEQTQYEPGIGMGLSISAKLLELMGSKLKIQSQYEKGSTFSFEVQQKIVDSTPIGFVNWGKLETKKPEDGGENKVCGGNHHSCELLEENRNSHILIVDDEVMNLRIAKKILEKSYKVHVARTAKDAFTFLEKRLPDLILLDIHMPDMDGFQVMKKMQENEKYKEIPVIFLTADEDIDAEVKGFEMGAADFIKKPLVEDVMVHRIGRILELNHLQKNLKQEVERQTRTAKERHEKVEKISRQTMETLASTIDAKDRYTNGHSIRVAEYSKEIARRLGKSTKEQEDIYYIALLHDIGKIGIPDEIINKTSRLTDEEYAIIKIHPTIGADILENISELPEIAVGAHWHHERYDGKGYPDQLKGEEIPEVARIIGVADAYDAMTSNRSYRNILPKSQVRDEIEKGKGTQFDPVFAQKMLEMMEEDKDFKMREVRNGKKQ